MIKTHILALMQFWIALGATSGFVSTESQRHMICVVNLKTPVNVKLGTFMSRARYKGFIPICIASATDKQDCLILGCFVEFYCADDFFPDLVPIPLIAFERIKWCSTTGHKHAFLYKETASLL